MSRVRKSEDGTLSFVTASPLLIKADEKGVLLRKTLILATKIALFFV